MNAKIKVTSGESSFSILADSEKNIFKVNGKNIKNKNIDIFLSRLTLITLDWKQDLPHNSILDAPIYQIFLIDGQIKKDLTIQGNYPKNFGKFLALLDEVTDEQYN